MGIQFTKELTTLLEVIFQTIQWKPEVIFISKITTYLVIPIITYLVMKFILYLVHDKSIFPENKTSLMVLLISQ